MKGRVLVFLLLASSAAAQFDSETVIHRLRVRIVFVSGACDTATQVSLVGRNGRSVQHGVDERCSAEFLDMPTGTYDVNVSTSSVVEADTTAIAVSPGSEEFEIRVKRLNQAQQAIGAPIGPSVSVADLAIPAKARKEFDKANELIARQQYAKAKERLDKAIAIYPSYAAAYNNLGVVYARLGDREREVEALEHAISINDHFAPAYVNLGKMYISTSDFPKAETTLQRATACDPTDSQTLMLLTYVQLKNSHFHEAITTSRSAHALKGPHAGVHLMAALAFRLKREAAGAVAELELFLKEEPAGPRADVARKELDRLQRAPDQPQDKASAE